MKTSASAAARFSRFAWLLLGYTVLTVLFGAFVKLTGSGAGCGNNWPTCNGAVVPRPERLETLIEFTHRAMTGLLLLGVIWLALAARRLFGKGSQVRKAAYASLAFTLSEAAIGAVLVMFRLVERNDSVARAISISAHLSNTFLLLASVALTAHLAYGGEPIVLRRQRSLAWGLVAGLVGVIVLGISGAITSLGDTLFPAASSLKVLTDTLSPTAHFLNRLRLLHPVIATSVGLLVVLIAGYASHVRQSTRARALARSVAWLFGIQMLVGLTAVALKAPIALALIHLLLADALWVALVLTSAVCLRESAAPEALEQSTREPAERMPLGATVKAYVALTKPRVISLLLFTTLAAAFIGARGWPGGWLLLFLALGGYAAAGGANAINMVIDRDIDARMGRTSKRPTVTRQIDAASALAFAGMLAVFSFVTLSLAANLLSAMLAMAGLAFYVVVYTLMLKRRTWHNIVIGGAAGAFPPLVGYAAATGSLSPLAWYLFAIIFVWTPVHFWALALLIRDDYAKAGVPMLPVVHGERVTVLQILLYAFLTAAISILPFLQRDLGLIYLAPALVLNLVLVMRSMQLFRAPDRPRAVSLYKFSMLYLALMFLVIALDRSFGAVQAGQAPQSTSYGGPS